jgi:catechol 2,3-dioxygenase-like lactoylglutathione lyase family enzyme
MVTIAAKRLTMFLLLLFVALLPAGAAAANGPADCPATFFAVSVRDLEASAKWYTDAFGLEATKLPGSEKAKVSLLRGRGLLVELVELAGATPLRSRVPGLNGREEVHGLFKVGFFVKDLDAEVARLKAKGVRFKGSLFEDPVARARSILVLDNDDNIIQLFEDLDRGASRKEGRK